MCASGVAALREQIRQTQAPLAGSADGHVLFNDRWYGFEDGMYTAARLLEILMGFKNKPAEVFARLPSAVSTPRLRLALDDSLDPVALVDALRDALLARPLSLDGEPGQLSSVDGLRIDFADGWALVRPAARTHELLFRFEGKDEEHLRTLQAAFGSALLSVHGELSLPF